MITELPVVVPPPPGDAPGGLAAGHPMRDVTRAVAFEPDGWTDARRAEVIELFDGLADEWHTRNDPGREIPLLDALDRGLSAADAAAAAPRLRAAVAAASTEEVPVVRPEADPDHLPLPRTARRRTCLDVGAAIGLYSAALAERFPTLLSVDISGEMLRRAPAGPALRVQADASRLPTPDQSVDVLVLANAFLFPAELERVVAPGGVIVWVNSRGTDTPIHLTAEEVDQALGGTWDGVASQAGWGTWSVHWRR